MHCSRPDDASLLHREVLIQLKDIRNILDVISSTLSAPNNVSDNTRDRSNDELTPRMNVDATPVQVLPVTPLPPASPEASLDMSVASIESFIPDSVARSPPQLDLNL